MRGTTWLIAIVVLAALIPLILEVLAETVPRPGIRLATRLVLLAARMLPKRDRDRWRDEWLADLNMVAERGGVSTFVFALYILLRSLWIGIDLRVDGKNTSRRRPAEGAPASDGAGGAIREIDVTGGGHQSGGGHYGRGRPSEGPEPVPLHFRAQIDPTLIVGQLSTVAVVISREPVHRSDRQTDVGGKADAAPDQAILVEVMGRTNIAVIGQARVEVPVPPRGEPRALLFTVQATNAGEGEAWVVASQQSIPLLTLALRPQLLGKPSPPTAAQPSTAEGDAMLGAASGDVTSLRIFEQRRDSVTIYSYELRVPELRFIGVYESRPIKQDRDQYIRGLFARIEAFWDSSGEDGATFQEHLRAFGGHLFGELIPERLQRDLWEFQDRLAHIVVMSTEPFIPWELLHLKDPAAGRLPDETKFLAQLGLVRWLWQPQQPGRRHNIQLPERLRLRPGRARYVIPEYPDPKWHLPAAPEERAFLERHLGATAVPPHHAEVLALLRKPDGFDLLHFCGHGRAASHDIANAELFLEGRMVPAQANGADQDHYQPEPLPVAVIAENFRLDDQLQPVVVLNACQVGQLGHQLTSIGGFAEAFIGGGAGAFVSSLWSVGDTPARSFVEALYGALLDGHTMAEAVRLAREAAHGEQDATWLAYVVYAHPQARLDRTHAPHPVTIEGEHHA